MRTTNSTGHIIALSQTPRISFHLSTARLENAIKTCDLGVGNIYSPIQADGFVSVENDELDMFYAGETIKIDVEPTDRTPEIHIVSCNFSNVGRDFNGSGLIPINPWSDIFAIAPGDGIMTLTNGSLHINGKDGEFAITVADGGGIPPNLIHYVSYSILFYLEIDEKPWFCIIDPLLRISSTRPPNVT